MAQVASVSHEGVSCDGCMMPNFSGCRYKCLRCWDFDLCHACYTNDRFQVDQASDQQHDREHPMQCILSHHDFELFYAGDESKNYSVCRIAVITCPYCNERGFGVTEFYDHVMRNHEEPKPFQVNCPMCIGLVETESNRVVDNLKQHWASVHFQFDPALQTFNPDGTMAPIAAPARRISPAAALLAAQATLGNEIPGPFDLPPTARNGATRRPMMARRAARQQPGGERTDRENRTETREQRQQAAAAAAFGMPWTENDEVQDLFRAYRLVRNAPDPLRAPAPIGNDRERGRMQRLRNLQQSLQQGPGNLVANAEIIQRIMSNDLTPLPVSYSGFVRGANAESAGEYASPRPHAVAVAPRSRTPPVNVIVGLGSRAMASNQYDHVRQEQMDQDRSPSVSTLTSGDAEGTEDEEVDGEVMGERGPELAQSLNSSSCESETKDEARENTDTQRTEEDDMVDALSKQQAIADSSLTQDEVVDMRRGEDPFAVRIIDPMKAIRAHASTREWQVIKRMLKNNDLRAKDEWKLKSVNADGRLHRMDEEVGDSEDEITVDDLYRMRPAGPKDEEDYRNNWLTVRMDTTGLSFASDSYWKDKRFITRRKLERQNSAATMGECEEVVARNALKALSITRTMTGGKVLDDTTALTQGEEIRDTLGLWDMRAIERNEHGRPREIARKCDESLVKASRELDFDYDAAILTVLREEYVKLEKELSSQIGSPSSASASARLEKQKKYLESLRLAGAGGSVVLQNPRDDPDDQQELQNRLQQLWGETPAAAGAPEGVAPQEEDDRPGTSN